MSQRPPTYPPLHAAPISHTMVIPTDSATEPEYLALPDAPAVCIFESTDQRTLLLATTASARDLARRRLAPLPSEERSARADLRCICGRVHAIRVGSSLESDAVYLHQARTRLPVVAQVAAERWRAWFAHVNPDDEHPQWTKTNLMVGLVGKRKASSAIGLDTMPPGVFLGPLPDKDAAGRFIESMIDAFDLCRYHNLLVQAPKAAACAYKEMGRCAAPCDGTETMDSYRARTHGAVEFMARGRLVPTITKATRDFVNEAEAVLPNPPPETALFHAKQVERLNKLRNGSAFAHVSSLHDAAWLLLLPSAEPNRVRAVVAHRGSLVRIADVDPHDADALVATRTHAEKSIQSAPPLSITPTSIDTISILARWLFMPEKKRRGEWFRLDLVSLESPVEIKQIQRAAKSILLRAKQGEVETHEIEGGV